MSPFLALFLDFSSVAPIMMNWKPMYPDKMVTHSWANRFRDLVAAVIADAMDDGQINNPDADENTASLCSSPTCRPLMLSVIEGSADLPPDIPSADALDCSCLSSNTVQMPMCSMDLDGDDRGFWSEVGASAGDGSQFSETDEDYSGYSSDSQKYPSSRR